MNTGKDYKSTTNLVKDKKCYLLVESHRILNSWKNDMPATICALPTLMRLKIQVFYNAAVCG
jgi:UDP-N-acetylglucosamine 2-epimerase